jgi:hypothetical protein
MIKKVYTLETYALYAREDYVVMATIAHNRTEREVFDILKTIYEDMRVDEESTFLFHWV